MLGINAIITNHFKMLVRDMYNQSFNKVDGGDTFGYGLVIFMPGVMKGDRVTIIRNNSGSSNNWSPQISADIFNGDIRRTWVRFCSNIKAIRVVFVNLIFEFVKRRTKFTG